MEGFGIIHAWNAILSIGGIILVYILNGSRERNNKLEDRVRNLEIDLPKSYVTKTSMKDMMDRIDSQFAEVKNMIRDIKNPHKED